VTSPSEVAASLAEAARTINGGHSLEETLDAIVWAARSSIPGIDHAGISTTERGGKIVTRAHTDQMVLDLDDLQYALKEGPCVDALYEDHVVAVPDIRHDQRWPNYVAKAVPSTGLKSQVAVRLFLDDKGTLGGLNLYSTEREDVDPDAAGIAELFAVHAAIALGQAKETVGLNEALGTRKVIGQAIGIVMERYQLNEDRAFAFLARASSTSNIKLRDIAQELVDEGNNR